MVRKTMSRLNSRLVSAATVLPILVAGLALGRDSRHRENSDNRRSSLVQRPAVAPPRNIQPQRGAGGQPAVFPGEYRSIDGTGNNQSHPTQGAAGTPLRRAVPAAYGDGVGNIPGGQGRPSPRLVSNATCAQLGDMPNDHRATAFLWQWGQFLDHDLDETPITSPAEEFDIIVPTGDPQFDPGGVGGVTIPLDRSAYVMVEGVRQQINNITSYIDASNVYGSDAARAMELRALDGTGRLKTSTGDLLPFNPNGFPNAPTANDPTLFLAGDIRSNEQVALTAMHTLFVREHNYWADEIHAQSPELNGDEVYQRARAMVAAEMQAITYNEFLPVLLGANAIPPYAGYDENVDASVANMFAAAAYRVGHTLLSTPLMRVDRRLDEVPAGHLPLAQAFFNPQAIHSEGIDSLLRGLAAPPSQRIDCLIIDDVRNFLFGQPGQGGFDLASLNLQRGRDHGLGSYNDVRETYGRPRAQSFADISPDPAVQSALAAVYASADDVDPWLGLLAEPHYSDAMVGETLWLVLRDQFIRARDGDRFWYEAYLPAHLVSRINRQTLARIIRRNTSIGDELQDNVFVIPHHCAEDFDDDGIVGIIELNVLLASWGPCAGCPADIVPNDVVDVLDLMALLDAWGVCD